MKLSNYQPKWLFVLGMILVSIPCIYCGFSCLSNPCLHGVCIDDLNSTYFCYCIDGYTGIQCQTNWNECWSSPCRNGGSCVDGIAMFNCSCPPGFTGDLCEEDVNECESNPCWNNGTCLDDHNGYSCSCLVGYSGLHCEIDVAVCNSTNETRCFNGGICEEGPGETFTCKCPPGWGNVLCDEDIDECKSSPCQNGAVCMDQLADYVCACTFGYSGKNCEETVQICSKNTCKNGALCLIEESQNVCYCVPDFHGELCQFQYDECQLGPRCLNGGSCIDGIDNFTCSCPPKLTGVLCECLILNSTDVDCSYIGPPPTDAPTTITTTTEFITSTETSATFTTLETTSVPNFSTELSTILTTNDISFTTPPIYDNFTTGQSTLSVVTLTTAGGSTDLSTITETVFSTITPSTLTSEIVTFTSDETSSQSTVPSTLHETLISTSSDFTTSPFTTLTSSDLPIMSSSSTSDDITKSIPITSMPNVTEVTTITTPEFTTTSSFNVTTEESRETSTTTTFFTSRPIEVTTWKPIRPTSSRSLTDETTVPTTVDYSSSPSAIFKDCSLAEHKCQNGGSCFLTEEGHKCACPFDTEGELCEIHLGIRNAAFTGNSYLMHRFTNISHISFEFEAKTLSDSGLVFYCYMDSTFLALYIENGYLMFKFSCGYQTMLLSEVNVPVNTGYIMNIKAEFEYSHNFQHCDAVVKLNNTLTMMGDQMAVLSKFGQSTGRLYLGGLPADLQNNNLPGSGFIGCISDLKISGKNLRAFQDADDGFQITECSSLACLSNPCHNRGECIAHGNDWKCNCRNGFLGTLCEKSVCDDNPCFFGGTCIPFSNSGYLCLCPYGKHGHFCENDIKITEPYFSSSVRGLSSFVAYPVPDGIFTNVEISFRFSPSGMEQISILLFIGQNGRHDVYSDHLAVSFVKGYIMLTWNLGSGPRRIFTNQPIPKGARDYLVRLGCFGRRAWLFVENLGNVTGRAPGNLVHMDVVPLLYLGGHDSKNFSNLPHDLPLHTGFLGCIFDVQVKSGNVLIPLQGNRQTVGRAIGQCGTTECYEQSCDNNGACLHHGSTFMCLCQDSWYGPLCSATDNICDKKATSCSKDSTCVPLLSGYECDCPFGRTGASCMKDENISDVSLTGRRSYIALRPMEINNSIFNMELHIKLLNDQGIIWYIGSKESSFICLSLQNKILELRLQATKHSGLNHLPVIIRSNKILVKGVWHKVQFGLFGRKVYLNVDHIINIGLLDIDHFVTLSQQTIFLGGLPDLSLLPTGATSSYPIPFTGCIRQVIVDSKHIPLIKENIDSGRNIIDCDGTPCGGDACENGGTCWLDSFMTPHCKCPQPYFGEKCQNVPTCNEKLCQNNGICDGQTHCSCKVGFTGIFCEKDIIVRTPQFTGKSFLIVQQTNEKKRNTRDLDISRLYLNFTTAKSDGLLLWTKKGHSFIGVGIENGFLKLTYAFEKFDKSFIDIPSFIHIADGLWHNLEIKFAPFSLKLDGKLLKISRMTKNKLLDNLMISSNGVFYIGGVPDSTSVFTETNGMFSRTFEGCIESLGTNLDIIKDFTKFAGRNIGVCEVF